jgi:metallophosphoesterase superfamily enzyme
MALGEEIIRVRSIPTIALNGIDLTADASGALIGTGRLTVIVADLHLEKGSSFARHGALLPPYDTRASLERLALLLHHQGASRRLPTASRAVAD